jgi:outer membrane receptor protein involved in Fe transport
MSSKDTETKRKSLLSGVSLMAAAAAALAGSPAQAQDTGAEEEEAIVVTGSRIPQPNLYTTSPVTQLTADDITTQGVTRVEDMTNQLPQVFAAQGSNVSNGASGTAQVSLRGLGAGRTLVLIDGRRMGYGSPNSAPADLNQIPGAMVERVEVLTGGASAVYGSDAIAGVVNFIMRDDFEGFRVDAQYGFYQHNNDFDEGHLREEIAFRNSTNPSQYSLPPDDVEDGYGKEITAIFGVSSPDGRGNVTAYLGYRSNDAVLQRDRDYSACALANPSTSARPYAPAGTLHWNCGGSATSFPGYFYYGAGGPGGATPQTVDLGTGLLTPFTPDNLYNFGPTNYYQRPDERYTLGAFAHYEINENIEAYAQAMFSDYRSVAQIAPSGDFFNTNTINCGNPFLPANVSVPNATGDVLCTAGQIAANTIVPLYVARRNVEGGGRRDDLNYQSYRMVAGLRGPVGDNWDYDVSGSWTRVSLSRTYNNDFSVTRLGRALNVVDTDPGPGVTAVCQSVIDGTDPACVPWNIFQPNGVTAEALAYLQVPLVQRGETIQQNVVASLTGDTGIGSPWAESNIAASFGLEYRRDELNSIVDASFQSGDGAGQGGPTNPLSGSTDVFEFFTEARVPIIEGGAFADVLAIDVAYRYSDYGSGISTDTYKIGGEWAPMEDIRFRAAFQRAVRAPNVIELFAAQGAGLFNLGFDPCDDVNNPDPVPAVCIGAAPYQVTAAQSTGGGLNNPAGQYNGLFGGNPNLEPEEAETITLGFVFTPSFIPGFNLSVDHFDIEVTNLIAASAAPILTDCYNNGNLASCALISRNPANGRLWGGNAAARVDATNTNIGALQTSGWDINANYNMDVGSMGGLSFQLVGTLVEELITDEGASTGRNPYDCVGMWSGDANCGTPTPEWRHRFRVSWETPWNIEANFTWRYFDEVHREQNVAGQGGFPADPTLVANQLGTVLDSQNYFDLAANWEVLENTRLRFGVNNILDSDPPLSTNTHIGAGFGNGNTFPQVYDALGRWIFVGATVDF